MRKTIVSTRAVELGNKGENMANKVLFPVRSWEKDDNGEFKVIHQRATDTQPYECDCSLNGDFVEWVILAYDVNVPGRGKVQLSYYEDDVRVKSLTVDTITRDSLAEPVGE